MTRNNPRHRWSSTTRQIGGSSRAKRHGPPIALSVYKNVLVSGDDDRAQYYVNRIILFNHCYKGSKYLQKIVTLQNIMTDL